jgi:hypothetical protein
MCVWPRIYKQTNHCSPWTSLRLQCEIFPAFYIRSITPTSKTSAMAHLQHLLNLNQNPTPMPQRKSSLPQSSPGSSSTGKAIERDRRGGLDRDWESASGQITGSSGSIPVQSVHTTDSRIRTPEHQFIIGAAGGICDVGAEEGKSGVDSRSGK